MQVIQRRTFLKSIIGLAAMCLPIPAIARFAEKEELIDLKWVRAARLDGQRVGTFEAMYRVDGGDWQRCFHFISKEKPMAWLTKNVGLKLHDSFWKDKR